MKNERPLASSQRLGRWLDCSLRLCQLVLVRVRGPIPQRLLLSAGPPQRPGCGCLYRGRQGVGMPCRHHVCAIMIHVWVDLGALGSGLLAAEMEGCVDCPRFAHAAGQMNGCHQREPAPILDRALCLSLYRTLQNTFNSICRPKHAKEFPARNAS